MAGVGRDGAGAPGPAAGLSPGVALLPSGLAKPTPGRARALP
jgi:hypothetical protein